MKFLTRSLIVLAVAVLFAGCEKVNGKSVTENDIKLTYKKITIEGKTYFASRTYQGYYVLSGPIEGCNCNCNKSNCEK